MSNSRYESVSEATASATHFSSQSEAATEAERIHQTIMARLQKINSFTDSIIDNIEIEKRRRTIGKNLPHKEA